jgi:hypothetical protein
MEVSEVRRRLRTAIEDTKRQAEDRRAKKEAAVRDWERVLADVAIPLFHQIAQALSAEGYRYVVTTPGSAVRLVPERGGEEFIEVSLDTEGEAPAVMIRSTRGRGRRSVASERPLSTRSAVDALTDDDLVEGVMEELKPLLQR